MLIEKGRIKMLGVTVLETVVALAIGALVLIGTVIYYTSLSHNTNVSKTVSDMNAIVAAYRVYGAGNPITASTSIATLQNYNLLPNPFVDPWGGNYSASVIISTDGKTPARIGITIANLRGPNDDADCAAIGNAVRNTAYYIQGSYCYFEYLLWANLYYY